MEAQVEAIADSTCDLQIGAQGAWAEGGMFRIREDDLTGEETRALLALHHAGIEADSPAGHATALDLSGLQRPDITVWSAWDGDEVVGVCALKSFDDGGAELKSMRTSPRHLRRGVGSALLDHIVAQARARGLRRISLQTVQDEAFEPALALYRGRGFADGEAFGGYPDSALNRFLHLSL